MYIGMNDHEARKSIAQIIHEVENEARKRRIVEISTLVKIEELRTVSRKFGVTGRSKAEIAKKLIKTMTESDRAKRSGGVSVAR